MEKYLQLHNALIMNIHLDHRVQKCHKRQNLLKKFRQKIHEKSQN